MSKDLVVLVPDKDIEQALRGLLGRPNAIGIRPITCELVVHPHHDPGCYYNPDHLLLPYDRECAYALVMFDRAWEGAPSTDPAALAHDVEAKLRPIWGERGRCIVVDPEIENWVWTDSPHVTDTLGWRGRSPDLRSWLDQEGLWPRDRAKPPDPKAAFERALRAVRLPPSAAIFRRLADTVSVQRCQDPSFLALVRALRGWFAA